MSVWNNKCSETEQDSCVAFTTWSFGGINESQWNNQQDTTSQYADFTCS